MEEIVAVDIGGTHARFALARLDGPRVVSLAHETVLNTADHPNFEAAWHAFASSRERPLPAAAAIALAGPTEGDRLALTNNDWVLRPGHFRSHLQLDRHHLVNDLGAVAHAVAQLGPEHFRHLAGPDLPLSAEGVISIVGPGTGLGIAQLLRRADRSFAVSTEGGHIDFAPLDPIEDRILSGLRQRYGRVSVERVASGPGLAHLYEALARAEGKPAHPYETRALWQAALSGEDPLAAAALERFCLILGAVAGDIALAQGAAGVVIAGGLGLRLGDRLAASGFPARFRAKGRFEPRMAAIPVKLVTHPQPGLIGAAAAFAERFAT